MTPDTIIALSTPPGVAALAIIRLSGPQSREIVDQLLVPVAWVPGTSVYRKLKHQEKILDDVVLTYWQAPNSFTGENTVEISCHGNPHIVENILRACLELGARTARPGEFTQRAYLNDKLSLTQAEGLLDLLYAPTERAPTPSARAMKEGRARLMSWKPCARNWSTCSSHLEGQPRFRGGRHASRASGRNLPCAWNRSARKSASFFAPRRWAAFCRKAR